MEKEYARKRERVIAVITRKNKLQRMAESLELEIQRLEKEIGAAQSVKDGELAAWLRSQQMEYKNSLIATTKSLNVVLEEAEILKAELTKELKAGQELMAKKRFFPRY